MYCYDRPQNKLLTFGASPFDHCKTSPLRSAQNLFLHLDGLFKPLELHKDANDRIRFRCYLQGHFLGSLFFGAEVYQIVWGVLHLRKPIHDELVRFAPIQAENS